MTNAHDFKQINVHHVLLVSMLMILTHVLHVVHNVNNAYPKTIAQFANRDFILKYLTINSLENVCHAVKNIFVSLVICNQLGAQAANKDTGDGVEDVLITISLISGSLLLVLL